MNSAGSEPRHQNWNMIFLLSAISFSASWPLTVILTWDMFTNRPSLSIQYPHIKSLVVHLFEGKAATHNYYWNSLKNNGLDKHFIAHIFFPATLALMMGYLAGKTGYVNGGRESVRHISGPKFYSYDTAIPNSKKILKNHGK